MSIFRQILPQLQKSRSIISSVCQTSSKSLSTTASPESNVETRPTVRKGDHLVRTQLKDFGKYVAECLPKFIEKVQITAGDELELLIVPEGVVPVLQFLKDHHNSQFANLVDIAGMDVPSRSYRYVVLYIIYFRFNFFFVTDLKLFITCFHCVSTLESELKHIQTN